MNLTEKVDKCREPLQRKLDMVHQRNAEFVQFWFPQIQGRNQRKISGGAKSLLATIMTSLMCSQPWCDFFAMISLPTLVEEIFS